MSRRLAACLLLAALAVAANAAWIPAKAMLAQALLERAWQGSQGGTQARRPWPGADTWPGARLDFPGEGRALLVLEGASARNLAFGPVHVAPTAWPGDGGSTVIAGHRDTHFRVLGRLAHGAPIALERGARRFRYRVTETTVMHRDAVARLGHDIAGRLLLITCYPFGALDAGTPWRFVVTATAVPGETG